MTFTDRISIIEHCNAQFPKGVCIEIGVAGGHFTKQIMASWPTLYAQYAIDAWLHFKEGYDDACNLSQEVQDERYNRVMLDVGESVTVIRALSSDAAKMFKAGFADFIYLDANHSEEAVCEDLTNWWPVLKPKGLFSGHDYLPGNGKGYGVKAAVDRFAQEHNLPVYKTTQEYCRPQGVYGAGWEGCSFVLVKP